MDRIVILWGGMPRKPRITSPDLIRHVMARGNARMPIFLDETDYREFVHRLGEVVEEFKLRCWNYCLMPNHYHATLQPTLPNLSAAIRRLNGNYGHWWNRRHGRVGHVFQGRFKDQIVDREGYLVVLSRYVAMNPVRAGLIERAEDWPWSSYRATAGLSPEPAFLASNLTLELFGGPRETARVRYADAIQSACDEALMARIRSSERILGSFTFKQMVEGQRTEEPSGNRIQDVIPISSD